MKQKSHLTTAEFARLCGTTKDTLFLYDRKDILKPASVGENGYRYYSPNQLFDFDVVHMLKQTGSSLREIRECRSERNPVSFRALFERKIEECDVLMRELEDSRRLAERMLQLLDYATSSPLGVPALRELPEELLLTTPFAPGDGWENGPPQSFLEHLSRCDMEPSLCRYPVGLIYPADGFGDGIPTELYYFAASDQEIAPFGCHRKPAGRYVSVLFQGWHTARETLERALEYAGTQGLTLGQYAYEYDLVDFLTPELGPSIVEFQFPVI